MPNKRSTVPRTCETCVAPFNARVDHVKIGGGRFCSVRCIRRVPPVQPIPLEDGAVRIPIYGHGEVIAHTVVDSSDAPLVLRWRWRLVDGYAARTSDVKLHRELLGLRKRDGLEVDHIDRDKLNNRRGNLRVLLKGQNSQNVPGFPGTSRFRGVSWDKRKRRWRAHVVVQGRQIYLGQYKTEMEAAQAAKAGRAAHLPMATD